MIYLAYTEAYLSNGSFQDRGLATIQYFLAGNLVNGTSHLFNGVHTLVGLSFGDSPFKGANWWTFSLDLLSILGLFKSLSGSSGCS